MTLAEINNSDNINTFDEWRAKGYRIKKGMKALKLFGENYFTIYQVYKPSISDAERFGSFSDSDGFEMDSLGYY